MTSETKMAYGSLVFLHGRSRPFWLNQAINSASTRSSLVEAQLDLTALNGSCEQGCEQVAVQAWGELSTSVRLRVDSETKTEAKSGPYFLRARHGRLMGLIPELVDRERAAELLGGISTKTVDRLRARGELTTIVVSSRGIRIPTDSISQYIERRRAPAEVLPSSEEPVDDFPIPALDAIKREKAEQRAQRARAGSAA